jgi:hypothetical protein
MAAVRFSLYALDQLRERDISESEARLAVESPDQVVPGRRGRKVAHKRFREQDREHLLRVVFEESAGDVVVVTVYKTAKIRKYGRQE